MNTRISIRQLAVVAAFIAATLQGSRLPDEVVIDAPQVAQASGRVENRAGSGSDKEEYPPRSDGVFA